MDKFLYVDNSHESLIITRFGNRPLIRQQPLTRGHHCPAC